jgi:hypothetical protein
VFRAAQIAGGGGTTNGAFGPNVVQADFATVGGGLNNQASSNFSTVAGGYGNSASGTFSTVAGGDNNSASSTFSTVAGGVSNAAIGHASAVVGGFENTASGSYSFAAGLQANAAQNGTFVWADDIGLSFSSQASEEFAARATGGVRFVSSVDGFGNSTAGVSLAAGGSAWASISDRNAKANFKPVDSEQILRQLSRIPVETWNYKTQKTSIRHIGPMAQDFSSAFKVGEDDKHITTIDSEGVALAAIQGLYRILREKDA